MPRLLLPSFGRRLSARKVAVLAVAATLPLLSSAPRAEESEPALPTRTVRPGDTLSKIAARTWWQAIWEANREQVANPDLIFPGQTLVIPNPGADSGRQALRLVDLVDVLEASGDVRHQKPAGSLQLRPGDRLLGIGAVRTGAGKATVRMSDGTVARLGENSTLQFSEYALRVTDESTQRVLTVESGDIALEPYRSAGAQAGLKVQVVGAELDVASRAVDVRIDRDGRARVSVFDGNVHVRADAAELKLETGQGAMLEDGRATSVQLPPSPAPQAPGPVVGTDVKFVWQPVDGAKHYWLTVARDAQMRDTQFTGAVYDASEFSMRFNRKGEYYWTVDSVDARGFRSRASTVARFAVDPAFVGE
jgi:LysM repeat protein